MTTVDTSSSVGVAISLDIDDITPSPENDKLYRPVDPDDREIIALAESIGTHGLQEPIVVTVDGYILSGHRRHAAAKLAGLGTVPCVMRRDVSRRADPDAFLTLLREHNRQRVKTLDERVREEVIDIDQDDAYAHLRDYRKGKTDHDQFSPATIIDGGKIRGRAEITSARSKMLAAVLKVIESMRKFWPISDRQIHYKLLNDPPLIHASKPDSTYANDPASYRALTDLLTRARLEGVIPWNAIGDETRPVTQWQMWREAGAFIREQADEFLCGYWRDLMQSQPAHIEIIAEKLTVKSIVNRVAQDYVIPVTVGRGYCSIQPRHALVQRFKASGRDKLVLLMLSDFDPDGEGIATSFVRSLRDDFDVAEDQIHAVKVALTREQIERFKLPPMMKAKASSSRFKAFRKKHGRNAWELEALAPEVLSKELRRAIEGVIDRRAYESERKAEAADAQRLEATRKTLLKALPGLLEESR